MLHIVNGDSVGNKLREADIPGEILVWRELYPFGPVFKGMDEPAGRERRASYLERTLGIPKGEYTAICEAQERQLDRFSAYDEVVLWFEHDLFDQTMLCYLLHRLRGRSRGKTKLSLLCIGSYPGIDLFRGLGQLSVEQLETLSGTWQTIGDAELELGSRVWEAYTADQPEPLSRVLEGDTSGLPFVRDAFEAHLARLPSVHNGLGSIEQAVLEAVGSGVRKPFELFRNVGDRLHWLGMGDLEFWHVLASMATGPSPLLDVQGTVPFADFKRTAAEFRESVLQLTRFGQEVLAGERDFADSGSLDKWVGGIRLQGIPSWRWDTERRIIVRLS